MILFVDFVLCDCVDAQLVQSCLTLCDPMDYSPPGSSVHEIFQARILQWVSISFSRGSSQPRDWTRVSCTAGRFFTDWATREACLCSISQMLYFHFCLSQGTFQFYFWFLLWLFGCSVSFCLISTHLWIFQFYSGNKLLVFLPLWLEMIVDMISFLLI